MQEVNINKYERWIQEGKSFSEIRKDLLIRGFTEEQTTTIIATLNQWMLDEKIKDVKRNASIQWQLVGFILSGVSILITLYTLWIKNSGLLIIAGGGITTGLAMIAHGRMQGNKSVFRRKIQSRKRKF